MTHTLSACSFGRSLEGGEICHRHRRHPQDRQDEVQPRLVPFRCRVECCCWAVEQDRGRWRGGIGWMDGIRCGCGVYRQFSCANMSSYAQTSPPPGASRARRTSLRLPLFAAKSCRLRLRRSSAASTTYVPPYFTPVSANNDRTNCSPIAIVRPVHYLFARTTRSGLFGASTRVGRAR